MNSRCGTLSGVLTSFKERGEEPGGPCPPGPNSFGGKRNAGWRSGATEERSVAPAGMERGAPEKDNLIRNSWKRVVV